MNATLSRKALSIWAVAISFTIALFACGFASSAQAATPSVAPQQATLDASGDFAITDIDQPAASTLDYGAYYQFPITGYRVSKKYKTKFMYGDVVDDYNNPTSYYHLTIKNLRLKGSVTVTGNKDLQINIENTCYINGSISARNIIITGSGTLYVKGGIKATGTVSVSRNISKTTGSVSSKSFTLKSYNTAHKATIDGIEANAIVATNKAKIYAKGYSYNLESAGIACSYLSINNSAYVKGSAKRYGVDVYADLTIANGSLYASETASSPAEANYTCTALFVNNLYSNGGTISASASGKGSIGIEIVGASYIHGTVKAYGKNYGYGIYEKNSNLVIDGGKVTAYGGKRAINSLQGVEITNGAIVYAYGRKSTSTKSKYRVGDGICANGNITITDSKVTAIAKSDTAHAAILSNGALTINGYSTVSGTGKTGNTFAAQYGISVSDPAIAKVNGKRVYGGVQLLGL